VDVGSSTDTNKEFTGLEKPPGVTSDQRGRRFRLVTSDAGSLAVRSPVYLHRQQVGSISELELAPDGRGIAIEVFVEEPYDKDVTDRTVFWNASGLDVTLDATGLRLETQSLATVVAGGIAFGLRDPAEPGAPAAENTKFTLFEDRGHALAKPDTESVKIGMRFHQPLRGVGVGTVIDLEGIRIGGITEIKPGYDGTKHEFFTDLVGVAYPERLGEAYKTLTAEGVKLGKTGPQMLQGLVTRGLRAQVRSGNLLTGQIFIALVWEPNAAPVKVDDRDQLWVIPTENGGTDQIEDQIASIVRKIDKIPFDAIGNDLHDTTRAATSLLGHLDRDVVPDAKQLFARADAAMDALRAGLAALRDNVAMPDSALQQSARTALDQVERTAFSLRSLADYLQHHPESILRGRANGPAPRGAQ
ncbi:MAG TPA: MlaD family protein, partial [Kofleriaceae bacterium]|nr:MlaD family protein [Kofleriaceae bacterium]